MNSIGGGRYARAGMSGQTTNIRIYLRASNLIGLGSQQPNARASFLCGGGVAREEEEIWEAIRRSAEPLPIRAGEWQGGNIESPARLYSDPFTGDVGGVGRASNIPGSRSVPPREVIPRGALARVWWRTPVQLQEQQLLQGQMRRDRDMDSDPLPPPVPPPYFDDCVVAQVNQGTVGWTMVENQTEIVYDSSDPSWATTFVSRYDHGTQLLFFVEVFFTMWGTCTASIGRVAFNAGEMLGGMNKETVRKLRNGGLVYARVELESPDDYSRPQLSSSSSPSPPQPSPEVVNSFSSSNENVDATNYESDEYGRSFSQNPQALDDRPSAPETPCEATLNLCSLNPPMKDAVNRGLLKKLGAGAKDFKRKCSEIDEKRAKEGVMNLGDAMKQLCAIRGKTSCPDQNTTTKTWLELDIDDMDEI